MTAKDIITATLFTASTILMLLIPSGTPDRGVILAYFAGICIGLALAVGNRD